MIRCYMFFSIFLFNVLFFNTTHAQNLGQTLSAWSITNPIEKVYLQADRKVYYAGQTVWLKSYFLSGFKPSAHNSTLFLELINDRSVVVAKKVLPVFNSITYGQVDLPDTLSSGNYILRAYTPLMLNHDKGFLYTTAIRIFGKNNKKPVQPIADPTKIAVQFFAEGGNLVAGVNNNIAFKATAPNGMPVTISGFIKDASGNNITKLYTVHDGMGKFSITPAAGHTYSASIDGTSQKFDLPAVESEGVVLSVDQIDNALQLQLNTSLGSKKFTPAYCIGQMQHRVIFREAVDKKNEVAYNKSISTKNLKSGILQVTVFNQFHQPLAERLVFIDNKEYHLNASIAAISVNNRNRKQNKLSLNIQDSLTGNFSVAVTDADYDEPGLRRENIISSFLLTSDLPGYINNPAWYFDDNSTNRKEALDLLMMTNGWRRFKWTDVANNTLPPAIHNDPGYISLSGRANIKGSKKSFADRDLLVWVATSDSGRRLQLVKTDEQGRFKLDSVVFFDKAKILFSDVMGKKSNFITVKLNTDSLYQTYKLPLFDAKQPAGNLVPASLASKMQNAFLDNMRGYGTLLDNVNIEGRILTTDDLEKKYVSPLFAGNLNARTINLTGQFIPQINIFEWLIGRVPNLNIVRTSQFMDDYRLYFRQAGNNLPMQMFLDEMPLNDATLITTIPANQIALIKIYPQFIGARGNNSAIAIYTKRGDDLVDDFEATGDIVDYDGYSIIKEYYAPDYSTPVEMDYKDYRLTLNWQPEINVSGKNPQIPINFFNNDRTKKFKIIAEGFTSDGRLLMLEQTITP